MAANRLHDLQLIIDDLDARGLLARVQTPVDPVHDLAGVAAALEGGPKAVLFENVIGHDFPVFTGLYWHRGMLATLMHREEQTLPQYVAGAIANWQKKPVAPKLVRHGPVVEVTEQKVDLSHLPIPTHALQDAGPYFDAGVVIARDPETGVRNASIQRFQVVGKDRLHINIDAGRHLELYLNKAAARGESLHFTLNCGVGPGLHFAAAAPSEAAPVETDELGIASEFHGAPLELVRGKRAGNEMVAHAMWALECEIMPGELADEGPFAEVTGYYATVAPRPVVHVRAIHRRLSPVFHTILSGAEVWNSVGLLGEANVLSLLQRQVPGVLDCYFSHGGCGFYHCIVQMTPRRAGWAKQAIMAAFAAFPPLKMVTVVDEDVDLRSAQDVEWAMATRLNPNSGIVTIDQAFGHGLNPSFPDYVGPKVGFDATKPRTGQTEQALAAYDRAAYKPMSLKGLDIAGLETSGPATGSGTGKMAPAPVPAPAAVAVKGKKARKEEKRARKAQERWLDKLADPQPIDLAALGYQPQPAPASTPAPVPAPAVATTKGGPATPPAAPLPTAAGAPGPEDGAAYEDWLDSLAAPAPLDLTPVTSVAPVTPVVPRKPATRKPAARKAAARKPAAAKSAAKTTAKPAAKPARRTATPRSATPRSGTKTAGPKTAASKTVSRKKPGGFFE